MIVDTTAASHAEYVKAVEQAHLQITEGDACKKTCPHSLVRVWVSPGGGWHLDLQRRLLGIDSTMAPACIVLLVDSRTVDSAWDPPADKARAQFNMNESAQLPPSAIVALGDRELAAEGSGMHADIVSAFETVQRMGESEESMIQCSLDEYVKNFGRPQNTVGDSLRNPSSPLMSMGYRSCANMQVRQVVL